MNRAARIATAATAALALIATLSGCSIVGDVASEQLAGVGCAVATPIVEQVATDVQTSIGDLTGDPAAARQNLQTTSAVLTAAASQITDPALTEALETATGAVDGLILQAQALETTGSLDQAQVDQLNQDLTAALTDITGMC